MTKSHNGYLPNALIINGCNGNYQRLQRFISLIVTIKNCCNCSWSLRIPHGGKQLADGWNCERDARLSYFLVPFYICSSVSCSIFLYELPDVFFYELPDVFFMNCPKLSKIEIKLDLNLSGFSWYPILTRDKLNFINTHMIHVFLLGIPSWYFIWFLVFQFIKGEIVIIPHFTYHYSIIPIHVAHFQLYLFVSY